MDTHPSPRDVLDPDVIDPQGPDARDPFEVVRRSHAAFDRLGDKDKVMAMTLLEDLAASAETLAPFRNQTKIAVFGSARLPEHDDAYRAVVELSDRLADAGYIIVTGGGPGVMTAGLEGAGPGRAVGVNIELPFEQRPAEGFPVAQLKRFATRKLAMVRHVRGVVAAAGGFGTLDEVLEVLVLLQTGKKRPTPLVLLDVGTDQWSRFDTWVRDTLVPDGLVLDDDRSLYRVCRSVNEAYAEITGFWTRYRGIPEHCPDDRVVLRVAAQLTDAELDHLATAFADLCPDLAREPVMWPAPTGSSDALSPAVSFRFDLRRYARLRQLIDTINDLAPPAA